MRIPDPNGSWKAHPDEPRLLVRRDPAETGATYYRLLPEGRIDNYDGVTIGLQLDKERLDLNRNFPASWRQDHEQQGAGPFPASEPETRNVMAFISNHANITGAVAFHTYSGVLLRPYDDRDDRSLQPRTSGPIRRLAPKARVSPVIRMFRSITISVITPGK